MGVTVGVILEEIQALYKQHQQPCFLYLSSEVIKVRIPGSFWVNILLDKYSFSDQLIFESFSLDIWFRSILYKLFDNLD